ncbi:MAG: glycosyl hydrolase family 28-related protein [Armatimonadota bacterium]
MTLTLLMVGGWLAMSAMNAADLATLGDGKTDATAAIQAILDSAAEKGGGEVSVPAGQYAIRGSLHVPRGVTLAGSWQAPHHSQSLTGTVLLAYGGRDKPEDPALVELAPNAALRGVTIFYPKQRCPDVVPYPPAVRGHGMHASVLDVTLVNPYVGIDFTQPHELHYIRNVFGCPLSVGVDIDGCTDIGRVENVHFNPHYWMRLGVEGAPREGVPNWDGLRDWLWDHCTAFRVARSDWEYHLNTFSYGCRAGYHFVATERGACNGNFLGIAADWAWRALLVEQTQRAGLLITNGEWVGGSGAEAMVETGDDFSGVLQLANCSFWGPAERIARIGGRGHVSFVQCNFCDWDAGKKGVPAIEARGGSLIVQGSRFWRDRLSLLLDPGLQAAIITGNVFTGRVGVDNRSQAHVEQGMNITLPH